MLQFNKKRTDDITLNEFSTYLKRHKLDTYINPDAIPLIFDYIHPEHGGKVGVGDFLKRVEEVEFNRSEHNQVTNSLLAGVISLCHDI